MNVKTTGVFLLVFILVGCTDISSGSKKVGCLSNADCQTGYFCQVEAADCHTITNGTCQKISSLIKIEKVPYNKKHLTFSNQGMNWFSANNWCMAQRMNLVQLSDFDVSAPKDMCYYSSQTDKNNYCDLTPRTEQQLRDIFGNQYYYWTGSSQDSCHAFGMCFINNYIRPLNKDSTLRHAVCIN